MQLARHTQGSFGHDADDFDEFKRTFLYSPFLDKQLGMKKPYHQLITYGLTFLAARFAIRRVFRIYHMVQFVEYSAQPAARANAEEAAFWANAAPWELERAERMVTRFRNRDSTAARHFPLLWITWRLTSPQKHC